MDRACLYILSIWRYRLHLTALSCSKLDFVLYWINVDYLLEVSRFSRQYKYEISIFNFRFTTFLQLMFNLSVVTIQKLKTGFFYKDKYTIEVESSVYGNNAFVFYTIRVLVMENSRRLMQQFTCIDVGTKQMTVLTALQHICSGAPWIGSFTEFIKASQSILLNRATYTCILEDIKAKK